MPSNPCEIVGTGPGCENPEKGAGAKKDCLERRYRQALHYINTCLAEGFDGLVPNVTTSSSSGYNGILVGNLDALYKRANAIGGCVSSVELNASDCYCREISCDSTLRRIGGGGTNTTTDTVPNKGPTPALTATKSDYNQVQEVVFGTHVVSGNVIFIRNTRTVKKYTTTKRVKLDEINKQVLVNIPQDRIIVDCAIALSAGPIHGLRRIWANNELKYDVTGANVFNPKFFNISEDANTTSKLAQRIRFYDGSEDQLPDKLIGDVAFRGLAYIVFENFDVTTYGGVLPNFVFEITRNTTLGQPELTLPAYVPANDLSVTFPGYKRGTLEVRDPFGVLSTQLVPLTQVNNRQEVTVTAALTPSGVRYTSPSALFTVLDPVMPNFIAYAKRRIDDDSLFPREQEQVLYITQTPAGIEIKKRVVYDSKVQTVINEQGSLVTYLLTPAQLLGLSGILTGFNYVAVRNVLVLQINFPTQTMFVSYNPFTDAVNWATIAPLVARVYVSGTVTDQILTPLYALDLETGDYVLRATGLAANPSVYLADSLVVQDIALGAYYSYNGYSIEDDTLDQITKRVLEDAGLTSQEIDVTDIASVFCSGYKVNVDSTPANVLKQIEEVFSVVFFEKNGTISVKRKNNLDAATVITKQDRITYSFARNDFNDQLSQVTIGYNNRAASYALATQTYTPPYLEDDIASKPLSFSYPFVLTAQQAANAVERVSSTSNVVQEKLDTICAPKFSSLTPADIISVEGVNYEIVSIVEQTGLGAILSAQRIDDYLFREVPNIAVVEDVSSYNPLVAVPAVSGDIFTVLAAPSSVYRSGNLEGYSQKSRQLVASTAVPNTDVNVFLARVNSYKKLGTVTQATNLGTLINVPISIKSKFSTDRVNTITVQFDQPPVFDWINNYPYEDLLNSYAQNILAVGRELIKFQNYEIQPDGVTVNFTKLVRGFRNTDYAINNHVVGEKCAIYTNISSVVDVDSGLLFGKTTLITNNTDYAGEVEPIQTHDVTFPAAVNLRKVEAPTFTRLFITSRSNMYAPVQDDERFNINILEPKGIYVYIMAGPFDEARFNAYITANDLSDTSYVKRRLELFTNNVQRTFQLFYNKSDQIIDGIDTEVGDFSVAAQVSFARNRPFGYTAAWYFDQSGFAYAI